MSKFTRIVNRRRQEGEIPTLRVAVRNFCLECVGYSAKEVELCTDPECWLFPWRFGKTPKELKSSRGFAASGKAHCSRAKPTATQRSDEGRDLAP